VEKWSFSDSELDVSTERMDEKGLLQLGGSGVPGYNLQSGRVQLLEVRCGLSKLAA
jgi:hypothetical protein